MKNTLPLSATLTMVAAATALLASACSSTHYVHIRHPLHVGQVDPNAVPFNSHREESEYGLPDGILSDEASLTEVTPERICVQTTLWSMPEIDSSRGMYENYRIALLNDQSGVENTTGQIEVQQTQSAVYNGQLRQQIQDGTRRVCANYRNRVCVRWRTEPVYRTIYVPHQWEVTHTPANICFANGGFLTPSTTRVSLEVDEQGPARMVFEWQFDSAVANGSSEESQ